MAIRRPCGISFLIVKYPVPIRCVARPNFSIDQGLVSGRQDIAQEEHLVI